jgi:hypothetical protein
MSLPDAAPVEPANEREPAAAVLSRPSSQADKHGVAAPRPVPRRLDGPKRATVASNRPEPLRSVTLRLPASVADALRRASIQRSLDYIEPFSQQAIVETAVRDWLRNAGYSVVD